MVKIKYNPLVPYGFREQDTFNGLSTNCKCSNNSGGSTSASGHDYSADITAIKNKNQAQDAKDQLLETKNKEQDAAIAALSASTASTISLSDGVAPAGVSKRYIVSQGGNAVGNIDIPTNNVIESASYNPATKKITFVVTGGNNLEVDVQDIIGDVVQKSAYDAKVNELNANITSLKETVDNLKDTLDIEGNISRDTY